MLTNMITSAQNISLLYSTDLGNPSKALVHIADGIKLSDPIDWLKQSNIHI